MWKSDRKYQGDPLFSYDTEKSQEDLEKAKLELERIDNNIGNKQNEIAALEKEKGVQEMMHSLTIQCRFRVPRWN